MARFDAQWVMPVIVKIVLNYICSPKFKLKRILDNFTYQKTAEYYEWAKRMKFLLAVIYGAPPRHQTALKPFKKFGKNWNKSLRQF